MGSSLPGGLALHTDRGRGMTWVGVGIHITFPHWCLKIFPLYTHFCEMVHSPCIPPRGVTVRPQHFKENQCRLVIGQKIKGTGIHEREL